MLRPTGSGPLSALLVLAPLVALPILAVVGIPQFAPGNLIESQHPSTNSTNRKGSGTSESRLGEAGHADDLFAPLGRAANGFDDPLRRTSKKKSRSRNSRNDNDMEEAEFGSDREEFDSATQSRGTSRGNSSARVNVDDEPDFNSDVDMESSSASTSKRGSRSRPRAPRREDDLDERNNGSDVTLSDDEGNVPEGEQYADASNEISNRSRPAKSRDNPSRRASQSSDATDAELFEGPQDETRNPPKPRGGSRPPVGRGRPSDPNDAPIFQPDSGEENTTNESSSAGEEGSSTRKQPSRNLSKTGVASDPPAANETAGPTRGPAGTSPAEEKNLKDLFNSLKAAGMLADDCHFIYLEDTESFLFTCHASRGGSSTPQKFEAEASEPILAVLKVLKQVKAWQQKNPKKTRSGQL